MRLAAHDFLWVTSESALSTGSRDRKTQRLAERARRGDVPLDRAVYEQVIRRGRTQELKLGARLQDETVNPAGQQYDADAPDPASSLLTLLHQLTASTMPPPDLRSLSWGGPCPVRRAR